MKQPGNQSGPWADTKLYVDNTAPSQGTRTLSGNTDSLTKGMLRERLLCFVLNFLCCFDLILSLN